MSFPKLRYPIHTKGLTKEDRLILLAYDMIYRAKEELYASGHTLGQELREDLDANLSNLGNHIETVICGGDMALRFEGFDNLTAPIGVEVLPL